MFGRNNNGRGGGGDDRDNRPVCKFFLEGRCRFGDGCKNYHPRNQGSDSSNNNRFAPLQNGANNNRSRQGGFGSNANDNRSNPREETFAITIEGIKADLTAERPMWPLSAYAPGLNAPRQLIEGELEQSAEEVRLQYYIAQAANQLPTYMQAEQAMLAKSNQQVESILKDLNGARKFIIDAQYEHPNRNDAVIRPTTDFPRNNVPSQPVPQTGGFGSASGFGGSNNAAAAGNAFGRPSGLGAQGSGFGAPSALGGNSAFGRPSPLAGASTGFGKPSPLGGGSGFGQPSALGQSSGFGQPAAPSAFGAPSALGGAPRSAFGQPSQPSSGFGAPSAPGAATSVFGQPSQPTGFGAAQPAASGGFGQPSGGAAAQGSAFGQSSGFGVNKPSPFAAAAPNPQAQTTSPFAQPAAQQANPSPFAAASNQQNNNPFGGAPKAPSGFGAPSTASPFAQPAASTPSSNGFGQPSGTTSSGFGSNAATSGSRPANHQGQTFEEDGKVFYYQPDPADPSKRKKTRVWMPQGPPHTAAHLPDAEGLPGAYEGEQGERLKAVYAAAAQKGAFEPGGMPEVPPRREWIGWDI